MLIPFKELFEKHNIRPIGCLHIGANAGQEAEQYVANGLKTVIWVEALPDVFVRLCKNVESIPGHFAFNACVSDEDGKSALFHIANNEGQSSSLLEFGTHSREHPSVKFTETVQMTTTRADTLLRQHKIIVGEGWLLNIDVQGAEMLALRGMGDLLHRFSCIYIEVNERELYKGCPLVHEIDQYLAHHGFVGKDCKMMKQGWGDKFYLKELE